MQNAPYQAPYMYNNPYAARLAAQQQLAPMPQTPYFQPQQPMQAAPRVTITMVTSRAEVEAAQIPFDGTIPIFADFGHGVMYAKRLNVQTGTADIEEYVLNQPQVNSPTVEFAPMGMMQELITRMDGYEQRLQALTETNKARKFVPKKEESNE